MGRIKKPLGETKFLQGLIWEGTVSYIEVFVFEAVTVSSSLISTRLRFKFN